MTKELLIKSARLCAEDTCNGCGFNSKDCVNRLLNELADSLEHSEAKKSEESQTMTYEMAHDFFEDWLRIMSYRPEMFSKEERDAMGLAVLAMEKQIAKSPIDAGLPIGKKGVYRCVECCEQVYENQEYCKRCGQHIDWGD